MTEGQTEQCKFCGRPLAFRKGEPPGDTCNRCQGSWVCGNCDRVNGPAHASCLGCGRLRPLGADPEVVNRIRNHVRKSRSGDYETTTTGEYTEMEPQLLRLHLGCGKRRLPGFVHVDVRPDVKPDVCAYLDLLTMFEDNSAELIYACHVLEHIPRQGVDDALREWRRLLAPGGTLRLSVPNFEELAALYAYDSVPMWRIVGPLYGRQDYPENTHYCGYDFDYLAWTLTEAGFYDVRKWEPDEVLPAGYDDYSRARINGKPISLNVEATA